jgi:hypothetical protein
MHRLRKAISESRLALLTLLLLTLVSTFTLLTPKTAQAGIILVCGPDSYPGTITACFDANHKIICSDSCGEGDCDCTGAKYFLTNHTCCYI